MPASLEQLLDVAQRAGERAARICQAVLDETPTSLEKNDRSPVTLADYGCQAVILREISQAFPSHNIVAEEGSEHLKANIDKSGIKRITELVTENIGDRVTFEEICQWIDHTGDFNNEYTWSIDPIDGTKGFLRRQQYAVAIGVLKNHVPSLGVLACPNLPIDLQNPKSSRGIIYAATRGKGAKRIPLNGKAVRTITTSTAKLENCRVLGSVESSHGDPSLVKKMISHMGISGDFVRYDSQVKYGILAEGNAEIYVRPRSKPDYRENSWDHVAGVVIAQEAGGTVTDLDGKTLDFSKGKTLANNRGVLATASREIHDAAIISLQKAEAKQ